MCREKQFNFILECVLGSIGSPGLSTVNYIRTVHGWEDKYWWDVRVCSDSGMNEGQAALLRCGVYESDADDNYIYGFVNEACLSRPRPRVHEGQTGLGKSIVC